MSSKNILSKASTKKIKIKSPNTTSLSSGIKTEIIKIKRVPKFVEPSNKNIQKITDDLFSIKLENNVDASSSNSDISSNLKSSSNSEIYAGQKLAYPYGNLGLKTKEEDTLTQLHYGIIPIKLNFDQAQRNYQQNIVYNRIQILPTWFLFKSKQTYQINIFPANNFKLKERFEERIEERLEEYYDIPREMVLNVSEIQPLINLKVFIVYLRPSFLIPPVKFQPYIDPNCKKEWRCMIDLYNHIPIYFPNQSNQSDIEIADKVDLKNPFIGIMNYGFAPAHLNVNVETVNDKELKQEFPLLLLYQDFINQYSSLFTKI